MINAEDLFGILKDKETLTLKIQGVSMQPFLINGRDAVTLAKPTKKLKVGDIIVFKYNRCYLIHRIIKIDFNGITTMGDYSFCPENIQPEDVVAIVTSAIRDGKTITPTHPIWLWYKILANVNIKKFLKKVNL